jgi:hypothetical protein
MYIIARNTRGTFHNCRLCGGLAARVLDRHSVKDSFVLLNAANAKLATVHDVDKLEGLKVLNQRW